jgi:hypothetical protein
MLLACASRHVAVNGNTKKEISDALSMGSSIYTFPPATESYDTLFVRQSMNAAQGDANLNETRPEPECA